MNLKLLGAAAVLAIAVAYVAIPRGVDAAGGGVSVYGKGANDMPAAIGAEGDRLKTSAGSNVGQGGVVTLGAGIIPLDGGYLAATQIPQADAGFPDRNGITIQNLSASEIWCGFSSSTNSATGLRVDGSPDGTRAGGTFQSDVVAPVYCWSTSAQTAPANIRWTESR